MVIGIVWVEDLIDVMEGLSAYPKCVPPALHKLDEVVDIDIDIGKW